MPGRRPLASSSPFGPCSSMWFYERLCVYTTCACRLRTPITIASLMVPITMVLTKVQTPD
eukprot:2905565-Prymnesium_polylepis.1